MIIYYVKLKKKYNHYSSPDYIIINYDIGT